eukprot:COSAG02_NODE_22412_length_753_cov_1.565749_2_plen_60_part_01
MPRHWGVGLAAGLDLWRRHTSLACTWISVWNEMSLHTPDTINSLGEFICWVTFMWLDAKG